MSKDSRKKSGRGYNYFEAFEEISAISVRAAASLRTIFQNYRHEELPDNLVLMHQLEHDADEKKHAMMQILYKDFLPPIEREDIIELAHMMDDMIDSIEDVIVKFDMFQLSQPTPDMMNFIDIVCQCTKAQDKVIREFHNFKKSKDNIVANIIQVNHLEEKGDALYTASVKNLFRMNDSSSAMYALTQIYRQLERCCDACESAANTVEGIILKNS